MSVALRLILTLSTLVACTALLGVTALSGLAALGDRYRLAEDQYRELRALYEVGFHAASVRTLLNTPDPDPRQVREHLAAASASARSSDPLPPVADDPRSAQIADLHRSLDQQLQSAAADFDSRRPLDELRAGANRWLAGVAAVLPRLQDAIVANREHALAEHRATLTRLAVVFAATALLAVIAGVLLYRSLMRSIRSLGRAASCFAQGDFAHRAPDAGDREFRALAREFNHMGRTIDTLHASMHEQIDTKSKALIRSERLAGLGVLAAGLAHEINNPLAIISGHAQLTLRAIRAQRREPPAPGPGAPARSSPSDLAACDETLAIITEEAFRCRDIVRRLLALAHPDEDQPRVIHPADIVRRAIALISPLPLAKERTIGLRIADPDAPGLACRAHPPQLLQVLINLLTNALEASPPGSHIEVILDRAPSAATISICDHGSGMDERTLAHAFDPFFTDKPRRGLSDHSSGTGLGLFVSHSIVQRHRGRLLAHSDGPGRGSTFTVELPLASGEVAADPQEFAHAAA
jgi:signal transduction histidine kinase